MTAIATNRLYRRERLRSTIAIGRLFPSGQGGRRPACAGQADDEPRPTGVMAFPWRAVYMPSADAAVDFPRLLVMVPKRRLRHAVDRVTMRRRMREAYRISRASLLEAGMLGVDLALIYVADKLTSTDDAARSLSRIFTAIRRHIAPDSIPANTDEPQ